MFSSQHLYNHYKALESWRESSSSLQRAGNILHYASENFDCIVPQISNGNDSYLALAEALA